MTKKTNKNKYTRQTKEYYAKMADNYPLTVSPWRMELISKYNSKSKKIIDLGCGTGNYMLQLPNDRIYGVDFSKESITKLKTRQEYLKIRKRITAKVGDILHMPFDNNLFDIAFSFSTLYNIFELDMLIPEIYRVMNHGGIAILEFGNKYSINSVWDKLLFHYPQFHFSEKRIRSELDKNGFKIKKVYYRQVIPNFWNRFDKDFVKNPLLQKISFRIIFIVEKK